jgi:hypothetical protein
MSIKINTMRNLISVFTVGLFVTNTSLGQNTSKSFEMVDSSTIFNMSDSLELDKHTEFALSTLMVICKNEEELDFVVNTLGNNDYPEEFVLLYMNTTHYPENEYIEDNTSKKFKSTFVYVDRSDILAVVYVLRPSGNLLKNKSSNF